MNSNFIKSFLLFVCFLTSCAENEKFILKSGMLGAFEGSLDEVKLSNESAEQLFREVEKLKISGKIVAKPKIEGVISAKWVSVTKLGNQKPFISVYFDKWLVVNNIWYKTETGKFYIVLGEILIFNQGLEPSFSGRRSPLFSEEIERKLLDEKMSNIISGSKD